MNQTNIIAIMTCFDNNYAFPAGVAFYSLLENSNKDYEYKLYVLHTDISEENQTNLQKTISHFNNATLEFINMENKFDDLFQETKTKGHYSKEMFYKFLAPSIFPQYDKIIISDVDVVFLDDISMDYINFNVDEDFYYAGIKCISKNNSWLTKCGNKSCSNFTKEEKAKLITGAGYLIFNLKKIREDRIERQFIEFVEKNKNRITQPEQDTINIVCYPKIKELQPRAMICSYLYDLYRTEEDYKDALFYTAEEIKEALNNPIQLHYATAEKPWNGAITKADIWFKYIVKTEMLNEYIKYQNKLQNKRIKTVLKFTLPHCKYKFRLVKEKIQ